MAMARADNFHSRLVFWLKIILPLAALGLLATLFLFGRTVRPEDAIPYADSTIADRVKQPRLTGAAFAGMTLDGSALKITAAEARPGVAGATDAGSASDLTAFIEMPDGSTAKILAGAAQLNQAIRVAVLNGGVTMISSVDYTVKTSGMTVALDQTDVTSLGPVTGAGPAGTFVAQKMHLFRAPSGGYLLDFTGGVRLVYTPKGGL
ncbi:MAG: LPS export ABC transporter periplasmic protein LptC [Cypionkella sp.]